MKKIVFIESRPPDYHIFTWAPLPRLGTIILGTILKKAGYEVKSYIETMSDIDVKDLLDADIIGISTITSTAPRSYEIANLLRQAGKTVFMGGPHVTYMTEEALQYADYVIRGEADDIILDFIRAIETGTGIDKIPGLSYKVDGKVVHNPGVSYCKDVDTLPIPDFTIIGGLDVDPYKKLNITPVMTSRGCPYDCSFCSVTKMFGHKYRFRSKDRVIEELKHHRSTESDWVFFYDDNFTANPKRSKELLHTMIEEKLTPHWTAQVRVEVAKDPELLDLMKRSGCHTVYIGFESINPETLKAYNKKQSLEDIEKCIKILHQNGIRIHGMFVFGSDEDTIDTIEETVKFAKKNRLESVQFLILTPLPGTKLYYDFKRDDRIISEDWSLYDAHHVVFKPKRMTYYELQSETLRATKNFYSIGEMVRRLFSFDLFNVSITAYGRSLTRKWIKNNKYFIDYTKALTEAGKTIKLAARERAADVKQRFMELGVISTTVQPETRKSF